MHKQYEAIRNSNQSPKDKDQALARLMTTMEKEFGISALYNEAWEAEHKAVIALYRILSESRETL